MQRTQIVRLDAGSRRLEFHTTVDWHESHTLLKVCFPLAVRAPQRDLRDAVRLRRAADALLDELGPRALRGARPPLGRPLRARLRRRAAERLEVRLQLLRQRAAAQPAALAEEPRPGGRHGPPRVRVRAHAARRRLARRRRRRGGAALQRAAAPDGARRSSRSRRSTTRTSCSTRSSAPRTPTRSCCASTRRTAAAASRASASPRRSPRRAARTRSRTTAMRSQVDGQTIVVPYRPHEIVTVKVAT